MVLGLYILTEFIELPHFYFHRLLIFSYMFQFFYNHLYFGLGWESSFRHFVIFHMKTKNIIFMYVFLNVLYFIFSFVLIELTLLIPWVKIPYSSLNIAIVYLIVPNLLFVFIFPLLTIHIDLFNNKRGLVIHKFYGFPLVIVTIAIPALLQYFWSNYSFGPVLACTFTLGLILIIFTRFSWVVRHWEKQLLNLTLD